MANRTVTDARIVRGTNPQYLVEKITRTRIYECKYWKEECFALSAELLVDKAMALKHIGGTFGGNIKPTPFLCLTLKMLQIQPEKDIVVEFIKSDDYKYVRALGAFYMRLVGTSIECYKYLEPLYNDYRKMKRMNKSGVMELTHMDEFIDDLLREERVCDIMLPRIQKRHVLESNEQLDQKISPLDDMDLEEEDESDIEEEEEPPPAPTKDDERRHRAGSNERHRGDSPSRERRRHKSRSKSPRRKSPSPRRRSPARKRSRSPKERRSDRDKEREREDRHRRKRSRSHSPSRKKR